MCGIVGIVGQLPVSERLVNALKHLEHRSYDSAGVATITEGALHRRRAAGRAAAAAPPASMRMKRSSSG
ncbi:hypothetical protein D3227_37220 [Mesorhizobium waimense]|uniref:Glutamine amidotransferase type-2 domain-containing protein n=1 Tax=Mesorhizobium waimense TaxID=1300307 RepID=A0A3A5JW75_9HYPH|nr:hypothetical protein [Mesorhizobium waimense]RJT26513.1 hypothetical protein D3227_37220 [Mesorhizobium waimense]